MPDELWTEVRDTVQETGIKTIPMEKKCKQAKWLSEEVLQIVVKRKVKGKGEKERYLHLNAEFQRIAKRDKKAFLSDQCKEIEENNRMERTSYRWGRLEPERPVRMFQKFQWNVPRTWTRVRLKGKEKHGDPLKAN